MPIRVSGTTTSATSLTAAARQWAEGFNFGSRTAVTRLDVPRTKAPTTGPAAVQRAYALYKSWEDNDLGSVRLLQVPVNGQNLWALHTTTDGDDGFLELYSERGALLTSGVTGVDANGRRNVTWDSKPGAVRERVAPRDASPSVETFFTAIGKATQGASPSGETVAVDELRAAARALVGGELSIASVDGWEKAGLLRVLNEARLTPGSRAWGEQLANLYTPAVNTTLSRFSTGTLGPMKTASAQVNATGAPPRLNTMIELSRRAFDALPTQVVPVTRTEAQALLRQAGATSAEARAAVDAMADAAGALYAGRFYEQGADWVPKAKGLALFGVSSSGRELKALQFSGATPTPPPAVDPRAVIKGLLGVDRPLEVLATRATAQGTAYDLAWLPPTGGRLTATLSVPSNGDEATVSALSMPSVIGATETSLGERVSAALGTARTGVAYASTGDRWVVAHRPAAGGPLALSTVKVALGGATASVTPATLGTSAADGEATRWLALGLARVHAETLVRDPQVPDAARLEVALRTRWLTTPDALEAVDPQDSAVGFDAARDRAQFMLGRVWGDNAVFVTFQRDGGIRLEDFN